MIVARGDREQAIRLYFWSSRLAGAFFPQLAHFEVLTRNALDQALRRWNAAEPDYLGAEDWTLDRQAAPLIYGLIGKDIVRARKWAKEQSRRRPVSHPRHDVLPTHDDVLAQLPMGTWVKILGGGRKQDSVSQNRASRLWIEALSSGFPHLQANGTDEARSLVAEKLRRLSDLRNRRSHHEHLLDVDSKARLNDLLSVLAAIDPELPGWVMRESSVRRVAGDDPRRT